MAEWLMRTDHGTNPDARADAAAAAIPEGFSFDDLGAVAELEALVALHHQLGALENLTSEGLRQVAETTDPLDEFLRSEVVAHADRGAPWLEYAESLVDAAYSASAALALVNRQRVARHTTAGSAGRLSADARELVVAAAQALVGSSDAMVTIDSHDADLAAAIAHALSDETVLALPSRREARGVRRRLLTDGHWIAEPSNQTERAVVVARVPLERQESVDETLQAVDEISLALRDSDAAVVIGPARVLVDALRPPDERLRADTLRSGRVRGIARLAPGLIDSAPREALALWMLGAPTGDVAIADRFTVLADLTDVPLTAATRADLVSDVVASMGSAHELGAHAFRFARFAPTASLLARGGSLTASTPSKRGVQPRASDLPARLDTAAAALGEDLPSVVIAEGASSAPTPTSVGDLLREGHLRVISGTRGTEGVVGSAGLVIVGASDLDAPHGIGATRVDQLAFASRHPSASLTRPGDVIFRTSPTAAAWVDPDGSKVVAYPARVLRIRASDPGGLVPEVVATDITGAPSGPGAWRRWMLRRVAPQAIAPLRAALTEIEGARSALEARAARLSDYADLLVAGATSGAIALTDPTTAADAASTQ
ncbi:hypothetical protein [Microbacterium sp. USHLN272]|uniref:hypothetical protein n=1 Tax=Microbacterium sp. USHLN272 TaxID=3081287 RepID=UPI003019D833